jgi:hypothetical protein
MVLAIGIDLLAALSLWAVLSLGGRGTSQVVKVGVEGA